MTDLDGVEYCVQEEYEAKINFQALDSLDPAIRAGIDMDLLAKITNTDPSLLDKYRVADGSLVRSPSIISQDSLHRHLSLTVHDTLQRSSLDSGKVNTLGLHNSSLSSITMLLTKSDSQQGTTYRVEKRAGDVDFLQVLSTSRPRSISSDIHLDLDGGGGTRERNRRLDALSLESRDSIRGEEREGDGERMKARQQAANEEVARWEGRREVEWEGRRLRGGSLREQGKWAVVKGRRVRLPGTHRLETPV